MKLLSLLAVATAIGSVCAAPAMAQDGPSAPAQEAPESDNGSGFYIGGGGNLYFLDRDYAAEGMPIVFEDQPSPGGLLLRLGYAFNQHVAIEVEAGTGAARSEFTTSGGGSDGKIGINSPSGAHLVLSMPAGSEGGYLLGKVGYVSAKIAREYLGVEYPDLTIEGPSFGIGGGVRQGSWDYRMEYSIMTGGDSGDGALLGIFVLNHF